MRSQVFFDLDGTLTDPRDGIVRSIRHALQRMDAADVPDPVLEACIGPPLKTAFADLIPEPTPERLDQAIAFYRERYASIGLYENTPYPGIKDLLRRLNQQTRLAVVTAKPWVFAEQILDHFQLRGFFSHIHGSELDGRHTDKAELLAHVLAEQAIDPATAVMIGDRRHDIQGAQANGITAIAVTWGYGSAAELQAAAPWRICTTMTDLEDSLQQL